MILYGHVGYLYLPQLQVFLPNISASALGFDPSAPCWPRKWKRFAAHLPLPQDSKPIFAHSLELAVTINEQQMDAGPMAFFRTWLCQELGHTPKW
eukprot:s3211_g8.t1